MKLSSEQEFSIRCLLETNHKKKLAAELAPLYDQLEAEKVKHDKTIEKEAKSPKIKSAVDRIKAINKTILELDNEKKTLVKIVDPYGIDGDGSPSRSSQAWNSSVPKAIKELDEQIHLKKRQSDEALRETVSRAMIKISLSDKASALAMIKELGIEL